ncbi:Ms5788A family Cys-rich leader peptide [Jatrophihabitans sp. GAS493]
MRPATATLLGMGPLSIMLTSRRAVDLCRVGSCLCRAN